MTATNLGNLLAGFHDEDDLDEVREARDEGRSEDQQGIDADVKALRDKWEAAGKPARATLQTKAGFRAAAKQSYIATSKDDRAFAKRMIIRAATLHKVGIVWAKDLVISDEYARKCGLPPTAVGGWRIKFTVSEVPPRKPRNQATGDQPTGDTGDQATGDQDTGDQDTGDQDTGPDAPQADGITTERSGMFGRKNK
jgi:hypothetical protein